MRADGANVAAGARGARSGAVVLEAEFPGGCPRSRLGALDVADSDWNLVPRCLLQVVDVGLVDFQAFAPAGVDVDLELEVMRVVAVRRGLVVDDGEPWGSAVCLVDDHVGPTGDGGVAEMQLEGPLDLPDPVQLVAPLLEVAVHQLPPPALHLAVPGAPGSREVEVVV